MKLILELTILNVTPGREADFEASFKEAEKYISSIIGYQGHSLKRCMEIPNKYILLVNWRSLEDHTIGFRESTQYLEWKKLLHHFYNPFPIVEHFQAITE